MIDISTSRHERVKREFNREFNRELNRELYIKRQLQEALKKAFEGLKGSTLVGDRVLLIIKKLFIF